MLLVRPSVAALALGTQCKNATGVGDEALLEMVRLLTPRVEAALNVYSLSRGEYTDYFQPPKNRHEYALPFRLSNGFVTGRVSIDGATDVGDIAIDREYGTLAISSYSYNSAVPIAVTYTSGFAVEGDEAHVHPDERFRVALEVPDWIEGVVVDLLTNWRRNNLLQPQAPKEYGFLPTLNEALSRDLRSRIYSRYMRPRDGHIWSSRCVVL